MHKSNLTENKRRHLLGEAVCGFARAQTVKEANWAILNGIQQLEGFGSSFVEDVRKVFPSGKNIISSDAFWVKQKDEIFSLEDKVLSRLGTELGTDIEHVRCNQKEQSFELVPKDYSKLLRTRAEREFFIESFWDVEQSSFSPIDEPMDYSPLENIHKKTQEDTIKVFALDPDFLKTLKDNSLINDIISLNKLWTSYNTIMFVKNIEWQQKKVRKCLRWLRYPSTILKEHYLLFEYLEIYNKMPRHVFEADQQGNLSKRYQIREEDYLNIKLPLKWLDRIKSDLSYCLVEFLTTEGYREWIYTCDNCMGFYVPKILYTPKSGHYSCSDKCRWEYHSSRPEVKEKKAAGLRKKFGWKKREKKATQQRKK